MLVGSKVSKHGPAALAESLDAPKGPPKDVDANTASLSSQQDATDASTRSEPQEELAHTKDVHGPLSAQHSAGESGTTTLSLMRCTCPLSQEHLQTALPLWPCPVTETCEHCIFAATCARMWHPPCMTYALKLPEHSMSSNSCES